MTLVHQPQPVRRPGSTVAVIGIAGMVGSAILSVIAFLIVGDVYERIDQSVEVTASAVVTVDDTLDVAADAMVSLGLALDTVGAAADQAAASADLVEQTLEQAATIVGTELPDTIDAVRETMPALIEASAVIDGTLRGLSFFGVPYNPEVPLDDAFSTLDAQLAPLSASLRVNAAIMEGLVPNLGGFGAQTELLVSQVEEIGGAVDEAAAVIAEYQEQAQAFDEAIRATRDSVIRGSLWMRVLVVLAGLVAVAMGAGLYLTGRALAAAGR